MSRTVHRAERDKRTPQHVQPRRAERAPVNSRERRAWEALQSGGRWIVARG